MFLVDHSTAAADKDLPDMRQRFARHTTTVGLINRHGAPTKKTLTFFTDDLLELGCTKIPLRKFLREEHQPDAVFTFSRKRDVEFLAFLFQESMRYLHEHASTVPRLWITATRATMIEVFENLQSLLDDVVRALTLDVGNESNSTGVVLELRVVESLGTWDASGHTSSSST